MSCMTIAIPPVRPIVLRSRHAGGPDCHFSCHFWPLSWDEALMDTVTRNRSNFPFNVGPNFSPHGQSLCMQNIVRRCPTLVAPTRRQSIATAKRCHFPYSRARPGQQLPGKCRRPVSTRHPTCNSNWTRADVVAMCYIRVLWIDDCSR